MAEYFLRRTGEAMEQIAPGIAQEHFPSLFVSGDEKI